MSGGALAGWSNLLVGHQWPDAPALAGLAAAAESRMAISAAQDSYADSLASIRSGVLASQQGVTADAVTASFRTGEERSRGIAVRNRAKSQAYRAALACTAELRAQLQTIATEGESQIHAVLASEAPAALKIDRIAGIVTDARTQANAAAAQQASNVVDAIQTVLVADETASHAREFVRGHGVMLHDAFSSVRHELIREQVASALQRPPGQPASSPTPDQSPYPDDPAAYGTADPGTAPDDSKPVALPVITLASVAVHAAPAEGSPVTTAEPAIPPAVPSSPPAVPGAAHPAGAPAAIAAAPAAPRSTAAGPAATAPLTRNGAGVTRPPGPPPAALPPAAVPGPAPAGPAPAVLHQPAVVRREPLPAAAGVPAARTPERAGAVTAAGTRLGRLLAAVVRQEPSLRWAIGDRADGSTVLTSDLAGGWVPPHVEIPVGVALLRPPPPDGDHATTPGLLTAAQIYHPGDRLPAGAGEDVPMSDQARDTGAPPDLGWELCRATRCRDGLPRLAHTLARAAVQGTGFCDSETGLLRDHLDTLRAAVLGGYPDHVDTAGLGDWQLLAAVAALVAGRRAAAAYHFSWFQGSRLR